MLLRRVSRHVREQNWLAVCIDLLIVVVGIFLGLQVNDWNEARQDRNRGAELQQRLQVDFREIKSEVDSAIKYHQDIIDAMNSLSRAVAAGHVAEGDDDRVRYALDSALKFSFGARRSATWVDIVSSGQTGLLESPELRSALSRYDELHQGAKPLFAQFWEGQRYHEVLFGRHFQYETERRKAGEVFMPGEVVSYDVTAMSGDRDFQQAMQRLMEYQVYYQIWHLQMRQAAEKVLALL